LYITHLPAAYFAESVLKRVTHLHETGPGKMIMLVVYVGIAFLAAELFHRWVERPFLRVSKNSGKRRTALLPLSEPVR
jgi:peptidoglycan/LPS O-acetylase OafA/YrhL